MIENIKRYVRVATLGIPSGICLKVIVHTASHRSIEDCGACILGMCVTTVVISLVIVWAWGD